MAARKWGGARKRLTSVADAGGEGPAGRGLGRCALEGRWELTGGEGVEGKGWEGEELFCIDQASSYSFNSEPRNAILLRRMPLAAWGSSPAARGGRH